jgi:hypothetical protein
MQANRWLSVVALAFCCLAAPSARAQSCPVSDSSGPGEAPQSSVLHGTVVAHYELREWLGLRLDHPACGETEIQLAFSDSKRYRAAETLRNCTVTATGTVYIGPTGYYSKNMAISDPALKPDLSCHRLPILPDPESVPIPPEIREFHASITVDYRGKGHAEVLIWEGKSKDKSLTPWRAYIHYMLNGGGDGLLFGCQKDFRIAEITQIPKPPDAMVKDWEDDLAETALQDLSGLNTVTSTCRRNSTSHDDPPQ